MIKPKQQHSFSETQKLIQAQAEYIKRSEAMLKDVRRKLTELEDERAKDRMLMGQIKDNMQYVRFGIDASLKILNSVSLGPIHMIESAE